MLSQKNSIHNNFLFCLPFPEFWGEFYLLITSTHNASESFWNTSLLYKWISKTIYTTILQIVKDRHYSFSTLSNTYWAYESESESRSVMSNSLGPHGLYIQSLEFSRQEYWSGLPFPSPGDLPNPGMEPRSLSRVRLFVIPWTAAHQAPLSMGFSRQEYWSGVPWPSSSNHTV